MTRAQHLTLMHGSLRFSPLATIRTTSLYFSPFSTTTKHETVPIHTKRKACFYLKEYAYLHLEEQHQTHSRLGCNLGSRLDLDPCNACMQVSPTTTAVTSITGLPGGERSTEEAASSKCRIKTPLSRLSLTITIQLPRSVHTRMAAPVATRRTSHNTMIARRPSLAQQAE